MVRHWRAELSLTSDGARRHAIRRSQLINGTGASVTALVLLIVVRYKFVAGAYLAIAAMIALFFLMRAIRKHYDAVSVELQPDPGGVILPSRNHAVVLVSKLHAPTLRALSYAKATRPSDLIALTVAVNEEEDRQLRNPPCQAVVRHPGAPGPPWRVVTGDRFREQQQFVSSRSR